MKLTLRVLLVIQSLATIIVLAMVFGGRNNGISFEDICFAFYFVFGVLFNLALLFENAGIGAKIFKVVFGFYLVIFILPVLVFLIGFLYLMISGQLC